MQFSFINITIILIISVILVYLFMKLKQDNDLEIISLAFEVSMDINKELTAELEIIKNYAVNKRNVIFHLDNLKIKYFILNEEIEEGKCTIISDSFGKINLNLDKSFFEEGTEFSRESLILKLKENS